MNYIQVVITDYYILIPSFIDINTFIDTHTIMDLDTIRVDNNIKDTILNKNLSMITPHRILCNIHLILNNIVISVHCFTPLV